MPKIVTSASAHFAKRSLLGRCLAIQSDYVVQSAVEERKIKGQFFTPPEACVFMAGLPSIGCKPRIRLLDPGAGVGTLTAAFCDRFSALKSPRHLEVDLFENDSEILPFLRKAMDACARGLRATGHSMSYRVHDADFVLDLAPSIFGRPGLFGTEAYPDKFDAVITNPPYFKINKASEYAQVMREVVHGQPNIYALFMAVAAEALAPEGQLVAITPRSFCDGPYFRSFRRWFFQRMALDRIHLFESRTETFEEVLQESLITSFHRLGMPSESVTLTASRGLDLRSAKPTTLPRRNVIDDISGHATIRIPMNREDLSAAAIIESWPQLFSELGLRISTGPVVAFRASEFLIFDQNGDQAVPLISVSNVKPFRTTWPSRRGNTPVSLRVCPGSQRLLLPTRNYIFLRRFSAKEEKRRLVASFLLASEFEHNFVAVENHLNYIYHSSRDLTRDEVYGLTGLLNSSLLDRYFRTISGNTQVNATAIRNMHFPSLPLIARIGKGLRSLPSLDEDSVERIVLGELGVGTDLNIHSSKGGTSGRR